MKKLAFIGPLPPPLGGVAVINQSFQNIDYDGYEIIPFDTAEKKDREDIYGRFKFKSVQRNLNINKRLKQFIAKEQPDVINIFITSGMSILRDILFLKTMHKFNIPIIIHFHSKTKGEFALSPMRLKIVGKYFNKYASKIIVLSDQHYSFFVEYFGVDKCTVIENFVNYSDFENEISIKKEDFLFVGRLSREKGFFDLLEAVKILKQKKVFCRIQIVGVAPTERLEAEIDNFIKIYDLYDYFVFNGATFGDEKYTLFKQSRCLIFPSHFENSPVVLKEAIAAKMAILSSDIDANENVLQKRDNYISFEKGNSQKLASKMIIFITNPNRILSMCHASSNIKSYDVSVAQEKFTQMFNNLVLINEK
ncbi:glycosyltransferase family 4 protein [Bizionia sp.]|uniref:glycosyltransferase family 4 protein n=1 Tax=Bizionia sp. TaxID=1954480 RepID=UPI003A8F645F